MIDIHTHILPYVDDGSPDIETSIELIQSEINQGVTDIFVTPHFMKYRGYLKSVEENELIFNQLIEKVRDLKLDVKIYLGMEIFYDRNTIKYLENKTVKGLGQSKYVLIEFSLYEETEDIPEAINNLTAKGYIPIIAHPERYPYVKNMSDYQFLKRMVAKIQINEGTIMGNYGKQIKKFNLNLIKNQLVDFIASDVHYFRSNQMKDAYEVIKKQFGSEISEKLFNNKSILN